MGEGLDNKDYSVIALKCHTLPVLWGGLFSSVWSELSGVTVDQWHCAFERRHVKRKASRLTIDKSRTQVQPDMEELTENAEEPDEGESKVSEVKLGKLQYKVNTHDFQTCFLYIVFSPEMEYLRVGGKLVLVLT